MTRIRMMLHQLPFLLLLMIMMMASLSNSQEFSSSQNIKDNQKTYDDDLYEDLVDSKSQDTEEQTLDSYEADDKNSKINTYESQHKPSIYHKDSSHNLNHNHVASHDHFFSSANDAKNSKITLESADQGETGVYLESPGVPLQGPVSGVILSDSALWSEEEPLEARPYCSVRSPGPSCCPGRDDLCTAPILDTVCYCDHFCNRTQTDCCPDFLPFCMGIQQYRWTTTPTPRPPVGSECTIDGQEVKPGETAKINCNNCTCEKVSWSGSYELKCTERLCLIRNELLEHVNTGHFGWRATNYSVMWGLTLDEGVRYRLGTLQPPPPVTGMNPLKVKPGERLPEKFDWREKSGGGIDQIHDQGDCAASWAFSSVSVAEDRLRIHSGGGVGVDLAPQQLVACSPEPSGHGCEGGRVDRAWWYMWKVGLVEEGCYPYTSGTDHIPGSCLLPRSSLATGGGDRGAGGARAPPKVRCTSPKATLKSSLVHQTSPPYRIAPNEREIMKEIMDNGPVQATIKVREDFYSYRSGVYQYSMPADTPPASSAADQPSVGYHAVKIIGWGSEFVEGKEVKYWICANVWGQSWGESGYFRIVRGSNESDVESFIVGVWPKINGRVVRAKEGRSTRALRLRKRREV